jgi:hypothetical protein
MRDEPYSTAPMNRALRSIALAISVATLLPGCGKKQQADVEADAERSIPAEERMPEPVPPPGTDLAASPATETAAVTPAEPANADFEAWFKKYGLDLNDEKMLAADADQDGFSNREEFLADTDPKDPNSRPGVSKSMRVKDYTEVNLPFVLRGVEGATATVEFTGEGAGKREKIKAGDTIRGTKLRVDRVSTGTDTDKHGDKVDMSQVIMTDAESQDRIVAVKDLPTRTSASYATLTDPEGKTTIKVREGDVFEWPSEPGASYKVIDLRKDQVVVKDDKTGKTVTIQRQ